MDRRQLLHGRRLGIFAGLLTLLVLAIVAAPASAATFSSTTVFTVPAGAPTTTQGPASPYPSTIAVSGLTGAVTDVQVTLTNVTHTFPGDLDILLVGPSGQNVVLLADVGAGTDIVNATLRFEDASPTTVPTPIVSGTYRPTNGGAFNGTPPAPAGPYGAALAIFNGTIPNGTWSLYVFDDAAGDTGSMGGWSLDITTNGPTISSFTPTNGPAGTQVVITGTNLTGATGVTFGGIAASVFTVNSATQITATVPVGAKTGAISVTTTNGSGDSLTNYQVSPPPSVTSFSPGTGKVGANVVITGANFTGASIVSFGGVPSASFTVNSATQITAKVPAGATTGPVAVTNPGGTGASTQKFVVRHGRSASLNITSSKASGRLLATDGYSKSAAGVTVKLQKRTLGIWHTVASKRTNATGRYSFSGHFSGRFRILAPNVTLATGDIGLQATSPTISH
jgi:subtilisin-like proprotein convertase family protein